jgi:hypothetical protein
MGSFFLASPIWLSIIAGAAVWLLYVGWMQRGRQKSDRSAFETRLRGFQSQSSLAEEGMESTKLREAEKAGLLRRFGFVIESVAFSGKSSRSFLEAIDHRLLLAGSPYGWIAIDFLAFCTLLIGGAAVFGGLLVQSGVLPVFIYLPLVLLCFGYPFMFLRGKIASRKEQAFAELPYFLDQLILGLSSGATTLDSAIRSVVMDEAQEGLMDSQRVLAQEFRQAYLEVANQVKGFESAYRDAAARIQVQEIDDLVEVFVDADETGSPILHILQDMSRHIYVVFEQNMATLIKKKDTVFTVATVIIMVSTAILIATPIVITVLSALGGQGG